MADVSWANQSKNVSAQRPQATPRAVATLRALAAATWGCFANPGTFARPGAFVSPVAPVSCPMTSQWWRRRPDKWAFATLGAFFTRWCLKACNNGSGDLGMFFEPRGVCDPRGISEPRSVCKPGGAGVIPNGLKMVSAAFKTGLGLCRARRHVQRPQATPRAFGGGAFSSQKRLKNITAASPSFATRVIETCTCYALTE